MCLDLSISEYPEPRQKDDKLRIWRLKFDL